MIGEEPIHPGSWQFPKLQGIKMNRWSNLLCNIQPDKVVGPCHTPTAAAPQCFPETLWQIRTARCPTPNAATTTLHWCLGSHGTGKKGFSAHARQVTSRQAWIHIYIYKLLYYRSTSHGYSIFRSRSKLLQVRGDNKKFPNYWGDLGDWRLAGWPPNGGRR